MKKILLTLLLLSATLLSEEKVNWFNYFTSGILSTQNKEYEKAIEEFSQAIAFLEDEQLIQEHLYIYNQRGQTFLLSGRNLESLDDFNKVAEAEKVSPSDKITALWGLTRCYARLDDIENFDRVMQIVKNEDPKYPKVESSKEYLVFRNFSQNNLCCRKKFACAMVNLDICDKVEDVTFTDSCVCIIKKRQYCDCSECYEQCSNPS